MNTSPSWNTPLDNSEIIRPRRRASHPLVLASAVMLLVGVGAVLGWLLFVQFSGKQSLEAGGLKMRFPASWQVIDTSQNQACQTAGVACVAVLTTSDDYYFNVIRYDQPSEITVVALDEREWQAFSSFYPEAILFSREERQVGGLPAIQRTFLQNNPQNVPVYIRQVYVINGLYLYVITAGFPSAELMEGQSPLMDQILASIRFTPVR
jgi:hypothetical protein